MIFGQIKMLITILLITGIAGAGMYVMKLRADNATLKANQIKLETAVAEQNKVPEQQEKDSTIMESNKKLNVLINIKKDLQDQIKDPKRKIETSANLHWKEQKQLKELLTVVAKNAARCIQLVKGAEHTTKN